MNLWVWQLIHPSLCLWRLHHPIHYSYHSRPPLGSDGEHEKQSNLCRSATGYIILIRDARFLNFIASHVSKQHCGLNALHDIWKSLWQSSWLVYLLYFIIFYPLFNLFLFFGSLVFLAKTWPNDYETDGRTEGRAGHVVRPQNIGQIFVASYGVFSCLSLYLFWFGFIISWVVWCNVNHPWNGAVHACLHHLQFCGCEK